MFIIYKTTLFANNDEQEFHLWIELSTQKLEFIFLEIIEFPVFRKKFSSQVQLEKSS